MTKENFTKFLNEKQRDSRLNEELFPRLRQDQIKALIDKYEPCSSNTNRSEARCCDDCAVQGRANTSACLSFQVSFLLKASWISWWVQRHQWLCWTGWPSGRTWPNHYLTTSSSPPTTRTWQVAALTCRFSHKQTPGHRWWVFSFPSPSLHSWSVLWRVVAWDVPTVSAGRVPLPGAGLLEGQTPGWRAHHYPWLHHDNWDPLQGSYTMVPLKIDPLHTENTLIMMQQTDMVTKVMRLTLFSLAWFLKKNNNNTHKNVRYRIK